MRAFTRNILIAVAAFPLAGALAAQGVTVQSTSDVHLYGALGTLAGIAARVGGAGPTDHTSTTYVSGDKMRTESENTGTIIDAGAGRFTQLDNKQKTYTSMTFADLSAAMTNAQQSAQQNAARNKPQPVKDPNAPNGDMKVTYKLAVDRTGETQKISGYDAERVFLTLTLEGEATPQGQQAQQVGDMVFLLDEWISKDAPQIAAMRDFGRAYAQKVGTTFQPQTQGLQAGFAADPRIKDGMTDAVTEMSKIPGIALRSVTYVALVPAGMTFDRKLVLNDASAAAAADAAKKDDQPKGGGGFRGLMGAIKSAADQSNKQTDKNAPPPAASQTTLMSVRTEVTSITLGAVPASTFEAPAGYREVKMKGFSPE